MYGCCDRAWHAELFDGPDLREHLSRFLLPGNRKPLDGAPETFEWDTRGAYLAFESGLLLMIDKGKKGALSVVGVEKKNRWFAIKPQ